MISDEFTAHTINILRVAAGRRQDVLAVLEQLESELVGEIAATGKSGLNQRRLQALAASAKATIQTAYSDLAITHDEWAKRLAVIEKAATLGAINAGIAIPGAFNIDLSESQLEKIATTPVVLGNSSRQWWAAQDADLRVKFVQQMQGGLLRGESVDEMVRRIRGTKAGGYTDGIMEAKRREAAALVRSSAIAVSNQASLATMEKMGPAIKAIRWLATLDTRTTDICMALSGKEWSLPDYTPVGHDKTFPGATAHWQCRSTQVPVLKTYAELAGRPVKDLSTAELERRTKQKLLDAGMDPAKVEQYKARSRASIDGPVDKGTTWEDFASRKTDAQLDAMLGPGRAALYRSGKIGLSDLTNQDNRPLTLRELKESIESGKTAPETFGRAGAAPKTQSLADLRAELARLQRANDALAKKVSEQ